MKKTIQEEKLIHIRGENIPSKDGLPVKPMSRSVMSDEGTEKLLGSISIKAIVKEIMNE